MDLVQMRCKKSVEKTVAKLYRTETITGDGCYHNIDESVIELNRESSEEF